MYGTISKDVKDRLCNHESILQGYEQLNGSTETKNENVTTNERTDRNDSPLLRSYLWHI